VNIGSVRSGEDPRGTWQKRPKNQPVLGIPLRTRRVKLFHFGKPFPTIFSGKLDIAANTGF
jgi:hypothetical protein